MLNNSLRQLRQVRAFTLIELLVVIAIIAMLAAILFPVFATAREKARSVGCLSNLKQVGLAYAQYEQDYDETVPCGNIGGGGQLGTGWAAQIYPYVKSKAVFLCPDDVGPGDFISYATNSNFACSSRLTYPVPVTIAVMPSPSQTVLLFEVTNCSHANVDISNPSSDTSYSLSGYGSPGQGILTGGNACSTAPCTGKLMYNTGLLGNVCFNGGANYPNLAGCSNAPSYINTSSDATYLNMTGVHTGGSNFLMADNHAKWFMPTLVAAGGDWYGSKSCDNWYGAYAPPVGCTLKGAFAATFSIH